MSSHFFIFAHISFCYSRFRLQLIAIHCNRRGVWTEHPHTRLSRTLSSLCTHHIVAQGVARRVCIKHVHPRVITCLSVCCFLVLSSSCLSCLYVLSLTSSCSLFRTSTPIMSRTPSIKNKAHPQNETIAPWRYTTLSHQTVIQCILQVNRIVTASPSNRPNHLCQRFDAASKHRRPRED